MKKFLICLTIVCWCGGLSQVFGISYNDNKEIIYATLLEEEKGEVTKLIDLIENEEVPMESRVLLFSKLDIILWNAYSSQGTYGYSYYSNIIKPSLCQMQADFEIIDRGKCMSSEEKNPSQYRENIMRLLMLSSPEDIVTVTQTVNNMKNVFGDDVGMYAQTLVDLLVVPELYQENTEVMTIVCSISRERGFYPRTCEDYLDGGDGILYVGDAEYSGEMIRDGRLSEFFRPLLLTIGIIVLPIGVIKYLIWRNK